MRAFVRNGVIPFSAFYGWGIMIYFIIQRFNLHDFLYSKEFLGLTFYNTFLAWGLVASVASLILCLEAMERGGIEFNIFTASKYWWDNFNWWARTLLALSLFAIAFMFYASIALGL
jgi:hypothetical protein